MLLLLYCYHLYEDYFYNLTPETNRVSKVYSAVAVLRLQYGEAVKPFPMTDVLYSHINTFRSVCVLWLASVVRYRAFQVCCSGIIGMILK